MLLVLTLFQNGKSLQHQPEDPEVALCLPTLPDRRRTPSLLSDRTSSLDTRAARPYRSLQPNQHPAATAQSASGFVHLLLHSGLL